VSVEYSYANCQDLLRISWAPDLVEAILEGRQPLALTVERLRDPIPLDWAEQRKNFATRQSR
jgi:hypothetical protein